MSKKCDAMAQVRVSDANRKWMEEYRKLLGIKASLGTLANMLMDKGREHIPLDKLAAVMKK